MLNAILQNLNVVIFLVLLAVGYLAGRLAESSHYRSIRLREKSLGTVLMFSNRFPPVSSVTQDSFLVVGSAVISEDYFKRVVAALQTIFGGRPRSYESLLDRARREAVLRMKQQAFRRK